MSKDHQYFHLVGMAVSPDNTKVAFGMDTVSRRQYTIQIKDLLTDKILNTKIENTTGGSVWAADSKSLFYTKKDPQTLRSDAVYSQDISQQLKEEHLVYEEEDETFSVYVSKSKSQEYLIISSFSTLTSEHRFVKSNSPNDGFKIFQKRITGLEYSLDHFGAHFYIHTSTYYVKMDKSSWTYSKYYKDYLYCMKKNTHHSTPQLSEREIKTQIKSNCQSVVKFKINFRVRLTDVKIMSG